jgi:hypoxanthine phosphoribosyltransferase
MLKTRPLFTAGQIAERLDELADCINQDFQSQTIDVVCILKGSFIFAADLIRRLQFPLRLHFIQVRSYTTGTESSGTVHLQFTSSFELGNSDILLIEDIVDTGITLQFVQEHLIQKGAGTLKTCVLLDKPLRRKVDLRPDYRGFEIEDLFVVGYGLDFNEFGRNMPYVAVLEEK